MVEWPAGASDGQRDANYKAQRWAHVLAWQVDRLHAARQHALEVNERARTAAVYPDEARWPFMEMDAEAHFALIAARQLVKALRKFDNNDRLPVAGLTNAQVRDVRDALEHWDAPGGSDAAKSLARKGADYASHVWSREGPGVLGEVVPDAVLRQWANEVYAELLTWDPYDRLARRSSALTGLPRLDLGDPERFAGYRCHLSGSARLGRFLARGSRHERTPQTGPTALVSRGSQWPP